MSEKGEEKLALKGLYKLWRVMVARQTSISTSFQKLNSLVLKIIICACFILVFVEYAICGMNESKQKAHAITYLNGEARIDNDPIWQYFNKSISSSKKSINTPGDYSATLTLTADFNMLYVWIYNEAGVDTFFLVDNSYFSVNLPTGIYSIYTGYYPSDHHHTILVEDSISLANPTSIQLYKEDAVHLAKYQFLRENSDTMRINSIVFYFFNDLNNSRLRITGQSIDSVAYLFSFNNIPDYFHGEWAVKGKQTRNGSNLYLINNELPVEEKDTVVTNNPIHLALATFYYHVPDSILSQQRAIQIFTFMPEIHTYGLGDPIYNAPVHMRVFQDTTADFSLITSTFFQDLFSWPGIYYIICSEIRLGSHNVKGYFYRDRHATSFVVSEDVEKVHLGLTPTYWFGKFLNSNDTIRIGSPYGYWTQLFLAQANDVLSHYPIDYALFKDGVQIRDGQFIPLTYLHPHMLFGFHPDSLSIPVVPGTYEIIITDNQVEIEGYTGISQVKAGFDLARPDKSPPNLILYQILANDELANKLDTITNNHIRFVLEDNEGISDVSILYNFK